MKPTQTQRDALEHICRVGRLVVYERGGFWTTQGAGHRVSGCRGVGAIPDWYCTSGTIKALAARRWLEPVGRLAYRITDAGREALANSPE